MESFVSVLGVVDQRNAELFDVWSIIHLLMATFLVVIIKRPYLALVITVLWEPLEIFILSPWLKTEFGITFGFESAANSLSDIVFDAVGVICGWTVLKLLASRSNLLRRHSSRVKSS